jgi:hypothetical protein
MLRNQPRTWLGNDVGGFCSPDIAWPVSDLIPPSGRIGDHIPSRRKVHPDSSCEVSSTSIGQVTRQPLVESGLLSFVWIRKKHASVLLMGSWSANRTEIGKRGCSAGFVRMARHSGLGCFLITELHLRVKQHDLSLLGPRGTLEFLHSVPQGKSKPSPTASSGYRRVRLICMSRANVSSATSRPL